MRTPNLLETHVSRDAVARFKGLSLRSRLFLIGVAVLVVGGAATFLFLAGQPKERVRSIPVVITTTAIAKDVAVVEHAVGTVVANTTVQVGAQVTGQLQRAAFQEGQIVQQGALLFVIDQRPFQAALQQAEAQRDKDQAQLVNAIATKKRYDTLFAQNAISSQQKDTADATAKSAAATVAGDAAAIASAKLNLGYSEIRSPVTGKTGPILIQPGNLVSANAGNPLVVLTQIEPVKISFFLPQTDLPQIQARERSGTLVALLDTHQPGAPPLRAKVDFVSNQVSNLTGTIELRATFDNKDHRLVPGQMVDVDVALNTLPKATVVPREAVNEGPNGRYIFVVGKDDTAAMRPVTVLFDDGTAMAVKGVKPKEKVIIDGQLRVLPGAKVTTGKGRKPGKTP